MSFADELAAQIKGEAPGQPEEEQTDEHQNEVTGHAG